MSTGKSKGLVNVDLRVRALGDGRLAMRVAYQNPRVSAHLPFQSSDGTLLTVVGSGRPYAGVCGGRLTLGLRGADCPDEYRSEPVVARLPAGMSAERAMQAARGAVRELRARINAEYA